MRLWDRVFTPCERKHLGASPSDAYANYKNATRMWREVRGGSFENAVIDVAFHLGFLSQTNREWLRREYEISSNPDLRESFITITWDKQLGELRLDGDVIRRVRPGVATNVDIVLDAFQEDGWPKRIDSPLRGYAQDKATISDTVKSLNNKLQMIRFFADGSKEGITWELTPAALEKLRLSTTETV